MPSLSAVSDPGFAIEHSPAEKIKPKYTEQYIKQEEMDDMGADAD